MALATCRSSASAAPLPNDFFGVSSPDLDFVDSAARVPILADEKAAGVEIIRKTFDWSLIEPTKGSFDWTATDSVIASIARAGLKVLPVVVYSPTWASNCPSASRPKLCPPASNSDFGDFLVTAIGRYGPNGSFWKNNPTVPKRADRLLADLERAQLHRLVGRQAQRGGVRGDAADGRADDPRRGPVRRDRHRRHNRTASATGSIRLGYYVAQLYAAGARGSFDTLAIHGYDETPAGSVDLVQWARSVMDANGDAAVPIWMTEVGWASAGKPYRFTTDLAGRGRRPRLADGHAGRAPRGPQHARHGRVPVPRRLVAADNVTDTWANHTRPRLPRLLAQAGLGRLPGPRHPHRAAEHEPPVRAERQRHPGSADDRLLLERGRLGLPAATSTTRVWTDCSSPYSVPALPLGRHSFEARATDPYGNTDPGHALAVWTVALPPPPPPVFDPADVRRDAVSLVTRLRKLGLRKLAAHSQVVLRVNWPGAGSVALTLKAGSKTVGKGSLRLAKAGHGSLHLKFSSSGRRLLARSRRLRLTLSETFMPSAGSSGPLTATAAMTLRR